MANRPTKFPPKFSQNIVYPAVYNLDEYNMPQSDYYAGTYFSILFPGYSQNTTPTLSYGKHKFTIIINLPITSLPNLKKESEIRGTTISANISRILYEYYLKNPIKSHKDLNILSSVKHK